ncbi:MAG: ccpA 2 [Phycisphaerales bacterium]|nr:ccpA 2 [Phycisphaerales bacterium]
MSHTLTPANQKQIAAEAGVSQSTVSLVLSGRGLIAPKTRQRVLDTADRLKYRPNLLVHGIQTGRTKTIGVMAPPFDSYWSQILYGIHDVLSAADHVPLMLWAPHDTRNRFDRARHEASELDQIHRLIDRRVDGVILWPPFATVYGDHIQEFSSRELPIVTIDHELPPEFHAAYVGSDENDGGRLVARHLYQLGHRRVGHLAGPESETWSRLRREAFETAFLGFPGTQCITVECTPGMPELSMPQARALIGKVPDITAIYATTDLHAKLVYAAAAERALVVPEDVSVVGFSDDDFAAGMTPPLTTVRQPSYEIGAKAAEVVLRLVNGIRPSESPSERLPVLLRVRGSTTAVCER